MKIAVLISGGVDSAVVVHKLAQEGHDLHLFYIRIGMDNGESDCSAEEDIEFCRMIARRYNLPLEIVPLQEEYWEHVVGYVIRTVRQGLTPHPDMMCNKLIKFGFFEERIGKDYDRTATGHYADIKEDNGRLYLATVPDPVKDQTDFLAQLSYDQLSHLMFPLGGMTKEEVRKLALEAGLPNATRKDSQGICFLGKIDYNEFLRRHVGEKEGPVIELETGKKIGVHKGFWFHTIGQRKGLGLSGGPWFVVRKNPKQNILYVSKGYDTPLQYGRYIRVSEMDWISSSPFRSEDPLPKESPIPEAAPGEYKVSFKTRHTPEFLDGTVKMSPEGDLILESDSDIQGIAPGQFLILYTPDRKLCLGSGMISSGEESEKRKTIE